MSTGLSTQLRQDIVGPTHRLGSCLCCSLPLCLNHIPDRRTHPTYMYSLAECSSCKCTGMRVGITSAQRGGCATPVRRPRRACVQPPPQQRHRYAASARLPGHSHRQRPRKFQVGSDNTHVDDNNNLNGYSRHTHTIRTPVSKVSRQHLQLA